MDLMLVHYVGDGSQLRLECLSCCVTGGYHHHQRKDKIVKEKEKIVKGKEKIVKRNENTNWKLN